MALLERVTKMKGYGMSEPQIIESLKQEGFSPSDIKDSLSQSKIKETLDIENNYENYDQENSNNETSMQPSIMANQNRSNRKKVEDSDMDLKEVEIQPPVYQEDNSDQQYDYDNQPVSAPQDYNNQEQYPEYNPDYNPQQGEYSEYQPPQAFDMETIGDIAEQIIEEKNEGLKKEVKSLVNFKKEISLEMKKLDERMRKIEDTFSQLQISILKKIGEYGDDIRNISNEMVKTQNSFSKILNPLTDNIRELKKFADEKSPNKNRIEKDIEISNMDSKNDNESDNRINKAKRNNQTNRNPSFDDYLR